MPASTSRFGSPDPGERAAAFAGVALVQLALALALLSGFRVDVARSRELVGHLIEVTLPPPPPIRPPPPIHRPRNASTAAPKRTAVTRTHHAGSRGPVSHHRETVAVVAAKPAPALTAGGVGAGASAGSGSGGGNGRSGAGDGDDGGTDLVQIAGAIYPSDYPKHLGNAGIGGRVEFFFTVGSNGRVTGCIVTRSSGVPELDSLTCRLVEQRFRYRPSTDRYGRPIADEVDGDYVWDAGRR